MVPPRLRNHSRDDSEALEEDVVFHDTTPTPPPVIEAEIDPTPEPPEAQPIQQENQQPEVNVNVTVNIDDDHHEHQHRHSDEEHQEQEEEDSTKTRESSTNPNLGPDMMAQMLAILKQFLNTQATMVEHIDKRRRHTSSTLDDDVRPSRIKVVDPPKFDGDSSKLNTFLAQLDNAIELQQFPADRARIRYAIGSLQGPVADSIATEQRKSRERQPSWLSNYQEFIQYLQDCYGDADVDGTAARHLETITQDGSAAEYFAKFRQYAAELDWTDQPLIRMARRGLKWNLRQKLTLQEHKFDNFNDFQKTVIRLDKLQTEFEHENRDRNKNYDKSKEKDQNKYSSKTGESSTSIPRNPIRYDRVRTSPFVGRPYVPPIPNRNFQTRTFSPRPFGGPSIVNEEGKITEKERERRRANGLCMYCGQAGHLASSCPSGATRNPMRTTETPKASPAPTK